MFSASIDYTNPRNNPWNVWNNYILGYIYYIKYDIKNRVGLCVVFQLNIFLYCKFNRKNCIKSAFFQIVRHMTDCKQKSDWLDMHKKSTSAYGRVHIIIEKKSYFIWGISLYLTLSKKNLLSHLYWGTQWTMEIS